MVRPLLMCFVLYLVSATSKPTKKDRVHHEEELSKLEHNDQDNFDFDHEAFLGHQQAEAFDELAPEESKRRLGVIVDKIDSDKNGFVTEEELETWIMHAHKKQLYDDEELQWDDIDKNKDGFISWEEYKDFTFKHPQSHEDDAMLARDERRFKIADKNGDNLADKEEYAAFYRPEEFSHMKDVVVQEAMDDMDKNKDGFLSMEEYIADMYIPEDGEEPKWLDNERKQFTDVLDQNKDGKLDRKEVLEWILPDEDHPKIEAQHLIHEADVNHDGKLTKEEILESHAVFVGSQVTNYGEALHHDEF